MYILLVICATLGYGLQNTLMGKVCRRMDPLWAATYRGFALSISMLPLLYFPSAADWQAVRDLGPALLLAAITGIAGNWASASSYRCLPLGIAAALGMGALAIAVIPLSYFVFNESMSFDQLLGSAAIIVGVLLLGLSKAPKHADFEHRAKAGLVYCLLFAIFNAAAYCCINYASTHTHPFLVGYAWEAGIGLAGLCVLALRNPSRLPKEVSLADFRHVFLASLGTVIGTGCFMYATRLGPLGVITAILSSVMVVNSVLARILYKEYLSPKQWVLIGFICLAVVYLKLVG